MVVMYLQGCSSQQNSVGCCVMSVQNLCQFTVVILHPVTFINNHVPPAHLMSSKNDDQFTYMQTLT